MHSLVPQYGTKITFNWAIYKHMAQFMPASKMISFRFISNWWHLNNNFERFKFRLIYNLRHIKSSKLFHSQRYEATLKTKREKKSERRKIWWSIKRNMLLTHARTFKTTNQQLKEFVVNINFVTAWLEGERVRGKNRLPMGNRTDRYTLN